MTAFRTRTPVALACISVLYRYTWWVTAVTQVALNTVPTIAVEENQTSFAEQACSGFASTTIGRGWVHADCMNVWTLWTNTVGAKDFHHHRPRQVFNVTATELRQRGFPCVVTSVAYEDGAGSSTVRYLATWMFAEEMGCDWVKPELPASRIGNEGASLYCHSTTPGVNHMVVAGELTQYPPNTPCLLTNWLEYFRFNEHGVSMSTIGRAKTVEFNRESLRRLRALIQEFNRSRLSKPLYDSWVFSLPTMMSSALLISPPSWDDVKQLAVRNVLKTFRQSFHQYPRPWYKHTPECLFSSSDRLDFAIHVRLGDRVAEKTDFHTYFQLLEAFMDSVTASATGRGLEPPAFHVFSESVLPCPSPENGTFREFPLWPVEMDQILPCLDAPTPSDCPEKRAGAPTCLPKRSGIFRVRDRLLYLHVGLDTRNDMSCMIQADGVLMGCSTFGQLAGLLSKGIKFFSMQCEGYLTQNQYKLVPPMAISEQGHMWIPVSGSWTNPAIASAVIFEAALDEHLRNKGL